MPDSVAGHAVLTSFESRTAARDESLGEIEVFGFRFHPMPRGHLLDLVFGACATRKRVILAGANLHGLYMFERSPSYRALLKRPETAVIVDGMPIIWMLRTLGYAVRRVHRTTWVDWFPAALARAAQEGRRVFILGHPPQVLAAGLAKARTLWPDLAISGHDGFFDASDPAECERVAGAINGFAPEILIVGMGMPRQEDFVHRYAALITAPFIGLGGAAFGYFAGEQKTPPRWMGQAGLEWAHRLLADPGRMAGRYLMEPFLLLTVLAWRLTREKVTGRS